MIVWHKFIYGLACASLLLAACNSKPTPSPTPLVRVTASPDLSAPLIPTPINAQTAAIGGVLLRQQPTAGSLAPISDAILYLAPVIYTADHQKWLVGLDEAVNQKTMTNQTGVFVFPSVEPGEYGLVLKTPVGGFLLRQMNGDDLLVEAVAGQSLNLGEVITDLQY